MSLRDDLLVRLATQPFDLLIVGGGIVGAGIARDAAMRGLKVALIEQGDFASGTSSKTSKLIHGGLRYLEHGHLRLVFESLRERRVLRTIAPEIVAPLSLLLPLYAGEARPPWKVRLGLWLYDLLALGQRMAGHRLLSPRRALELEPGLRVEGLLACGRFADCQMEDARLCLANVLQAIEFGATCCNDVRLLAFLKAGGRLCGAVGEDLLGGQTLEIRARVVLNAAGPWSDQVRRLSDGKAAPRLSPTKGSHLIVPRVAREAVFAPARADGRMLFLLPWRGYSIIGTTETAVEGDLDSLKASEDEVGYLLDETNRLLPAAHLDESDVIATYAGARPLLACSGPPTRASREHRIEVDAHGLISVMGGKFTTYRLMAQQAVDFIVARNRWAADRCLTDQVSLLEAAHPLALPHWREVTRTIDPELLTRLLARYGASAFRVLRLLVEAPSLARPVCPHHDTIEAELVHVVRHELACTVTDVLARRTPIAWSSCQGLDFLSTVVAIVQRWTGATDEAMKGQIEAYRRWLGQGLAFRSATISHVARGAADG